MRQIKNKETMKKRLTMEQMDVLIRLGVPTENANRGYERSLLPKTGAKEFRIDAHPGYPDYEWSDWKPIKFYRKWDGNDRMESFPAFNIENMIDLLPKTVDVNFTLQMGFYKDGTCYAKYHSGLCVEAEDLLDALFNLYVMCHEKKKLG